MTTSTIPSRSYTHSRRIRLNPKLIAKMLGLVLAETLRHLIA